MCVRKELGSNQKAKVGLPVADFSAQNIGVTAVQMCGVLCDRWLVEVGSRRGKAKGGFGGDFY